MQITPPQATHRQKTRRTESQWRNIVAQWQQSDLSIAKFCEAQKLSDQSFYAWKKKFSKNPEAKPEQTPTFIDLSPDELSPLSSWDIVLKLDNGMELQLSRH